MSKKQVTEPEAAPFPPEGKENLDPNVAAAQAAEETKTDDQKTLESAATGNNAVGGQGGGPGSAEITRQSATDKTITPEELAKTLHPLSPEVPLADPLAEKK